jgi:hypothetical protein
MNADKKLAATIILRGSGAPPHFCIYLDAMSESVYGNPETQEHDRQIRTNLRNKNYQVFENACSELDDWERVSALFYWRGRPFLDRTAADPIRNENGWFE